MVLWLPTEQGSSSLAATDQDRRIAYPAIALDDGNLSTGDRSSGLDHFPHGKSATVTEIKNIRAILGEKIA